MSMNGTDEKGVVEYQARDGQKIKLSPAIIKKYLVSGRAEFVTDQELYLYMGVCKSRGLNPFVRDCHLVKYTQGDSAAIITSIDYYRKRARAQRDCKGWSVGIVIDKGGELLYRKGTILLDGEKLVGGWAEATPEGWGEPMRKEVNLARYIKKTKDGATTRFWQPINQPEMIAKVAESQLLRSLWPDEFQGLHVDAEVASRDAQDELNQAVAGGGSDGGGDPGPTFEDVFKDEIGSTGPGAENPFLKWIEETCETYGSTFDAFKPTLIANAVSIKKQWAETVAERLKNAEELNGLKSELKEIKAEPEKAEAEKPAEEEPKKPKTFRDDWVNLTAKSFGPFVKMELDKFKALAGDEKAEAVARWREFYPEFDCPFADAGDAGADPGSGDDPEASELAALAAELKRLEKSHGRLVLKAKAKTQVFLPQSLDGFRILIDEINRLIGEKIK